MISTRSLTPPRPRARAAKADPGGPMKEETTRREPPTKHIWLRFAILIPLVIAMAIVCYVHIRSVGSTYDAWTPPLEEGKTGYGATTKDDVKFLVKFPAELIGKEPEGMPKQGFYNGGERMNILLQALLWLGFVVSGLTLWLGAGHISPAIRTWMIPLHSICAGLGFAAAIGHIYLAIGVNPDSFQGMRDGTVKESYAKHHHAKWVEGLEKEGKLETVERTVK